MELRGYAAQRSGAHPIIHGCGWRSFYLRARSRLFQTDHAPTGVLLACHHSRVGSHPLLFRVCYSRSQDLSMLHASSRYPLRPPCACVGRCVRLRAGPAEEATRERPSSRASPRRECPAPRRTATASHSCHACNRSDPTCHKSQVSPTTKHSVCLCRTFDSLSDVSAGSVACVTARMSRVQRQGWSREVQRVSSACSRHTEC